MWQGRSVSVVFPVYDEEEGIVAAIEDFFAVGYVDEIIAVDNNSRDRSVELIRTTRARLATEERQGYGFALRRGMREAKGDYIVLAEPDGTYMGKDIVKLLAFADDFGMVLGTRTVDEFIRDGANMGTFLRVGNRAVAKILECLFDTTPLSDCGCTFRLIHRDAAAELLRHLTVGGSHFLPEMVILTRLAGVRMIEVPVNYCGRLGVSKITGSFRGSLRVGIRMICLILKYRLCTWLGRGPRFEKEAS